MESPLELVQSLLALQATVGRPNAQVCGAIAGLKDLCDLHSGGQQIDWRRGPGSGGGGQAPARLPIHRGGGGARDNGSDGRPLFRNLSGSSLASNGGGREGGHLPRNSSARSFPSSNGSASPMSPTQQQSLPPSSPAPPMRYQSRFKNSQQPVEDKILNNIILSKLNKFSGSTYDDIREFLYQILGSGEPDLAEMIRHFMMLVFKKAAAEETYCPLYAKLLAEISSRYKVILEEMAKLQANYLEIFDDVEEVPEGGDAYETYVVKKKEKMYRLGYSQFLAELAAQEILELSNLERTFEKLFSLLLKHGRDQDKKSLLEEYTDCLVRMSRVLKKKSGPFFREARATLLRSCTASLEQLLTQKDAFPSLSPKARFILMDVKDNLSG